MKQLWVEKYRPKSIADYVWMDDSQKSQVEQWIKDKSIPHILFSGSPGTGKTTLAKTLINELGVEQADVLELNSSSKDRGIAVIQNKVTNFASTMPFGSFKIVLMDEADGITLDAQGAMRGTMEMYADNCRFILTCNYPHKVIPALHSRVQSFHIAKLDYEQFTLRAAKILLDEDVNFELDTLDLYVSGAYPDMRKCINNLQKASVEGKLLAPSNLTNDSTVEYRTRMVELFKAGKIVEGRKVACENVKPDEVEDLFRWMYDNLDLWSNTQEGKDKAVVIIRNGLVNHSMIADVEINLSATLVELTTI